MWIMVAGPYTSPAAEVRKANFLAMQRAARVVHELGHVPVIGVNQALPLFCDPTEPYWMTELSPDVKRQVDQISQALTARCDAALRLGRSPGTDAEIELIAARGGRIFESLSEIPPAS